MVGDESSFWLNGGSGNTLAGDRAKLTFDFFPNDDRLSFHNPANHEELLFLRVLPVWDEVSSLISSRNWWAQSTSWAKRLQATR